jgi:hypothetical protein
VTYKTDGYQAYSCRNPEVNSGANTKKQHPHHKNKQHKGPKPTQTDSTPNGDKGAKYKNKKTDRHCNFCDKDGHDESKCFKKMTNLEATMMVI